MNTLQKIGLAIVAILLVVLVGMILEIPF